MYDPPPQNLGPGAVAEIAGDGQEHGHGKQGDGKDIPAQGAGKAHMDQHHQEGGHHFGAFHGLVSLAFLQSG